MTNPTPHGQVPEALIDLIDAYAETRHRYGGIHNARTEAARNAVIEALSGVQALSAAPAVPAGACGYFSFSDECGFDRHDTADAAKAAATEMLADIRRELGGEEWPMNVESICWGVVVERAAEHETTTGEDGEKYCDYVLKGASPTPTPTPTPPAEQQAAPKAAYQRGYMDGMAKGRRDAETAPQQEAQEPAAVVVPCHTPSGKRVALYSAKQDLPIGTQLYTAPQPSPTTKPAPQPAPAPLSECLRLLNSFEYEGDEDSQAKAFFKAHINEDWFFHVKNSLELALAAQGGKDA